MREMVVGKGKEKCKCKVQKIGMRVVNAMQMDDYASTNVSQFINQSILICPYVV